MNKVKKEMFAPQIDHYMDFVEKKSKELYDPDALWTTWLYWNKISKEELRMSETMLMTQALDERDLLVKKINDKIDKLKLVDVKRKNEE